MRRRRGITLRGLLPIIGVMFLVEGGLVYGCRARRTFREVHCLVEENVPRGASPAAVLAFLTARHIAHEEYDGQEHRLWAHLYDVGPPLDWMPTDINLHFQLDPKDRLTE